MPNKREKFLADFDSIELRRVLGDFATGVTILACHGETMPLGMTANAFMSVSLDPPLVLVSIATGARMLKRLSRKFQFTVNILSGEHEEIARCYGRSKNIPDELHWAEMFDLPVIAGAAAQLGCEVVARHRHGDHVLVISAVNWIMRDDQCSVLTFHRGQFGKLG